MPANVTIVFYSLYGHVYHLAEAIAEGATSAGATVKLLQVKETLPDEVIAKMHATEAKQKLAHIPIATADDLKNADGILIGTPTRYGLPAAQMQAFFDSTGGLWAAGALIGKVGGVFTSSASQHGGQETTLTHMHTFFFHHGMVVAGVPYSTKELSGITEMSGGTPYGATTIAGAKGERSPTANELAIARAQGKFVAELAAKLVKA
ncbi:MAG TPA: NAD(P)H:quinone oxidoreductase [Tepidisphaeraceae bacterium]|jgi:NAD(P)H dehydrogenase (quinone)